jgi:hypothetical protein
MSKVSTSIKQIMALAFGLYLAVACLATSVAQASQFEQWMNSNAQALGIANVDCANMIEINKGFHEPARCYYEDALTSDEQCSLTLYTNQVYILVNRNLREGKAKKLSEIKPFINVLSNALHKLRPLSGTVYRYVKLSPEEISKYQVGQKILQKGFSSTANNPMWEEMGKDFGNVLFRIQTQSGHDISCYSMVSRENEWLLDRDSVFTVQSVKTVGDKTVIDVIDGGSAGAGGAHSEN